MSTLHERLLARVDAVFGDEVGRLTAPTIVKAVIELHSPSHAADSTYLECDGCPATGDLVAVMAAWPCDTIKLIGEALGVEA